MAPLPSRTIWRGNPASSNHQPDPADIAEWGEWVESSLSSGVNRLANCAYATTANITLSGDQSIDGSNRSDDDRILVKDQTDPTENGIYLYNSGGAWSRATDADADAEIANAFVYVTGGSANAGNAYAIAGAPELGTDDVIVTQVSTAGSVPGDTDALPEGSSNKYASTSNVQDALSGGGVQTDHIATGAATNAKLADMAQDRLKGRATASTGAPEDLTPAQVRTMLNVADGADASPVASVAGKTGTVTLAKGDVGLGDVDNTADADKPVSSAQQTALDAKAPVASPTFTGTVSGVTKAHVGLGNADNTADASKPVSSAQAAADAAVLADALARMLAKAGILNTYNPEDPGSRPFEITDLEGNVFGYASLEGDYHARALVLHDPRHEEDGFVVPIMTQENGLDLMGITRDAYVAVKGLHFTAHAREEGRPYLASIELDDGTVLGAWDRDGVYHVKDIVLADDEAVEATEVVDLAFPPQIWMIDGKPFNLYPAPMMAPGVFDADVVASFASIRESDELPFLVQSTSTLPMRIEPSECGPYARLQGRERGQSEALRIDLSCTVAASDALDGKAISVLALGDSLTESNLTAPLHQILTALGATPTFVGDISSVEVGADTEDGVEDSPGGFVTEGRGGTEAADWTYANTDDLSPVTDWTAYNALSSNAKEDYNPFLRPSTGGDPAERVKNGHIFDPATYFTETGNSPPDVWWINLGRNDVSQQDQATALQQIEDGVNIICKQIRAYDANVPIIWSMPRYSVEHALAKRVTDHLAARKVIETINDIGDARIICAPLWAYMDGELDWRVTTTSTDSETDVPTVVHADTVHPRFAGNRQAAWAVASIIAAHAALFSAA